MASETETRPFNSASFYAFLREGRFMGVRCRENGNVYAEARPIDPVSHSRDMEWHEFSGRATLSTFTCIFGRAGLPGSQGVRSQQPVLHRHRHAGGGAAHFGSHRRRGRGPTRRTSGPAWRCRLTCPRLTRTSPAWCFGRRKPSPTGRHSLRVDAGSG